MRSGENGFNKETYFGEGVTMVDENKYIQYGFPRTVEDILGITIHETDNIYMDALQLFNWLNDENKTSQGCHYICDSTQTVQVMPDDWGVYHTGKGMDWGNRYTIAIEICSSLQNDEYQSAQDRAIALIQQLQSQYDIPDDMIFFHKNFNPVVYCPKTILDRYGSVNRFVMEEF